jgi:adenine phosphoribosyltransferase
VRGDSGPRIATLIASRITDIPDFPQPGVMFKDITPLLADGPAFHEAIDALVAHGNGAGFDLVVGIEARGFVVAAAVAYAARVGVVPVRKAGKLPRAALSAAYDLEYGQAVLEIHQDAFRSGQRILVVDDVLATGGTAAAAVSLVEGAGGTVVGVSVLLELAILAGRQRLAGHPVHALLTV